MKTIYTTPQFDKWFAGLRDTQAVRRIQVRIDRAEDGHFGDHKAINDDIFQMRVFCGPGYRIYFTQRDPDIVILLTGGDKSTQSKDIKKATELARRI